MIKKDKRIRVLFLIGDFGIGGKERQLVEVIKNLSNTRYDIYLIKKGGENNHYSKEIENIECTVKTLRSQVLHIKSILKIIKTLRSFKPIIVHSWSTPMSFIISSLRLFLKGFVFIDGSIRQAPKSIDFSKFYIIQRSIIKKSADIIVANSYAGLESYSVPSNKGTVIHNGIDPSRIKNLVIKEELRLKFEIQTKFVVGMVARFDPMKDYETFIRAALNILAGNNDITFIAVGDGPVLNPMKKLAGNHNKIKFTGNQPDTFSLINLFDIGVLTSYSEGISNSIMEYMSLGKPVIATGSGGTAELVIHNETGFILPERKTDMLADTILYLLNNPQKRIEMGLMGRERIISHFSVEKMVSAFESLYTSCTTDVIFKS